MKNRARSAYLSARRTGPRLSSFVMVLTGVVLIACLYWAKAILIPVALALLLTFLLSPGITALQKFGLGRVTAVALVILLTLLVIGTIGWLAFSQVTSLAEELPNYRHNITQKIRDLRRMGKGGALEKLQETVEDVREEIERGGSPKPKKPVVIQTEPARSWGPFDFGPMVQPFASGTLVFALLIFMLSQREDLRNRLIRLMGYGNLTVTTKALEDAGQRISRYLLMQITINGSFGFITGLALHLIGLPYAFLWGLLSVPLLFIPLLGFWTAAALPTLLSLGVFKEWWWPVIIVALFLGLKTLNNMILEPLVYGKSVGVSQVPLLVTIAFWTWLWGPIGLVLATPITVCLVVIAKHVPQLEFISVLLSDEPVIDSKISYYQRLLAMDEDEARSLAQDSLKRGSEEQVYDRLMLPALSYAKADQLRGRITEGDARSIFVTNRRIVETLAVSAIEAATSDDGSQSPASRQSQKVRIVGCPAHDEADEVGLVMLSRLLDPSRYELEVLSFRALASEVAALVRERKPHVVCIATIPPGGLAQARYLCKRLRAMFPKLKILVGRWSPVEEAPADVIRSLTGAGVDEVGTSLLQTRDQIAKLRALVMEPGKDLTAEGAEIAET